MHSYFIVRSCRSFGEEAYVTCFGILINPGVIVQRKISLQKNEKQTQICCIEQASVFLNILRFIQFDDHNIQVKGIQNDKDVAISKKYDLFKIYKLMQNLTADKRLLLLERGTRFTIFFCLNRPSMDIKYVRYVKQKLFPFNSELCICKLYAYCKYYASVGEPRGNTFKRQLIRSAILDEISA